MRILLVTDEPMLAAGLAAALQTSGIEPPTVCQSIERVPADVFLAPPEVILIDLSEKFALADVQAAHHAFPAAHVILWHREIPVELATQARLSGARGAIRKTLPIPMQMQSIRTVYSGELWFEKTLADNMICARRIAVTNREGQLMGLLAKGHKNKEIAGELGISEGTVKVYLHRLFQKVGVRDRYELALFALKNISTATPEPEGARNHAGNPSLRSLVVARPDSPLPQRNYL